MPAHWGRSRPRRLWSWSWSGGPLVGGAAPNSQVGGLADPEACVGCSCAGLGPSWSRGWGGVWVCSALGGPGLGVKDYGFLCLPLVGETGLVAPQVDGAASWPSVGQGRVHQGGLKAACLLPAGAVTQALGLTGLDLSPGAVSTGPVCVQASPSCPVSPGDTPRAAGRSGPGSCPARPA